MKREEIIEEMARAMKPFPMLNGEPPIPHALAEIIYKAYSALHGNRQSLERIAERGGFGWREVGVMFEELRRRNSRLAVSLSAEARATLQQDQG